MKLFSFSVSVLFLVTFSIYAQKKDGELSAPSIESSLVSNDDTLLLDDDDQELLQQEKKIDSTAAPKMGEQIIESDEELILDGEEEYLLSPTHVGKENDNNLQLTDSSVAKLPYLDTVQHAGPMVDSSNQIKPVNPILPKPEQVVIPAKPVKIENLQSVNFAQNLKQYRSPKIAMLFSFLMPGTGQIYAHNKLKAGIFGAVEAAIISTGVGFAVKGKKEMKKAQQFADDKYSVEKFQFYYDSIFYPGVSDTSVLNSTFSELPADEFIKMANNRGKDDEFYEYIKGDDRPYVRGWKDVTPTFQLGFRIEEEGYKKYSDSLPFLVYHTDGDSTIAKFGFSEYQKEFESKFSRANNFYDISQKVFFLLILDRIVSAVDAGITAKAYNDEMLGKQSFWQKVNILEKQVKSGSDIYTGYALEVRF